MGTYSAKTIYKNSQPIFIEVKDLTKTMVYHIQSYFQGKDSQKTFLVLKDIYGKYYVGTLFDNNNSIELHDDFCSESIYTSDDPGRSDSYTPTDISYIYQDSIKNESEWGLSLQSYMLANEIIVLVNKLPQGLLLCLPITINEDGGFEYGSKFVCTSFSHNRIYINGMEGRFNLSKGEIDGRFYYKTEHFYYDYTYSPNNPEHLCSFMEYDAYQITPNTPNVEGVWEIYDTSKIVPIITGVRGTEILYADCNDGFIVTRLMTGTVEISFIDSTGNIIEGKEAKDWNMIYVPICQHDGTKVYTVVVLCYFMEGLYIFSRAGVQISEQPYISVHASHNSDDGTSFYAKYIKDDVVKTDRFIYTGSEFIKKNL